MVGEPTTFTKAWFDAFPEAATRRPCSRGARAQDRPGDRADAARERDRRRGDGARPGTPPAGDDRERDRRDVERLGARPRHRRERPTRARSSSRTASRSSGPGPGIRTFTATGSRPMQEHEPTLFEIWVCADGYWCDHTKNLVPGELDPRYAELEQQLMDVYAARSTSSGRCQPRRARPASPQRDRGAGYPGPAEPSDLPRVGARAHEPPYAHQAGGGTIEAGWCSRSSPASTGRRAAGCASRTTS